MKKTTIMTIILAILLIISNAVFAAETANLTISASEVSADKTITTTIKLGNNVTVNQWDFTVKFDSSVLEYVSTTGGNHFTVAGGERIVGNTTDGKNSFTVTFKVKDNVKAKTTTISLADASSFEKREGSTATPYDITVGTPVTVTLQEEEQPVNETTENTTTEPENNDNETTGNTTTEPEDGENETTGNTAVEEPSNDDNDNDSTNNGNENENTEVDRYDQTGANIAVVGAIALVVVLGTTYIIKRK